MVDRSRKKTTAKKTSTRKSPKTNSPSTVRLDKAAVLSAVADSHDLSDALGIQVKTRIVKHISSLNAASKVAKDAFKTFRSQVTAPQQADPTFVENSSDLTTLRKTQKKVFGKALGDMSNATAKRGLRAYLSDVDIAHLTNLGLTAGEQGKLVGRLDPNTGKKIQELVTSLLANLRRVDPFARYPLLDACSRLGATKAATSTVNQALTAPAPVLPPGPPAPPPIELKTAVFHKIREQIKDMTSPESHLATEPQLNNHLSVKADLEEVHSSIDKFRLQAGPADNTAFHDIYDLQIALPHIWTTVFDDDLANVGQQLYEQHVRVQQEVGVQHKNETFTSVEQLKRLKDDVRLTFYAVAEGDDRFIKVKQLVIEITLENWASLDEPTKVALYELALTWGKTLDRTWGGTSNRNFDEAKKARQLLKFALDNTKLSRVEKLLQDLETRLTESYKFDIFAPNSINFGILVNYRQKWDPLYYQVGDLVNTIPLAPKEIRKYVKKRIVKKSRTEKEVESGLRSRKEDSATTFRVDAEIVRKAENSTNFNMNTSGGVDLKIWSAKGGGSTDIDSSRQSALTKKEFREAVLRAAEEYKREHKLDISTSQEDEVEDTFIGHIENPNEELPVTFLFYELQRLYTVSEKLHKVTPVVLVANDVPSPDAIDEEWLMAHDWILKRAILDDSFLPALDYLRNRFVGDEVSADVLRQNLLTHVSVVEKITQDVEIHEKTLAEWQEEIERATELYAETQTTQSSGLLGGGLSFIFGGSVDDSETKRILMEATKERLGTARAKERELRSRMGSALTALQEATNKYTHALENQMSRRTQILRLRSHVKDNILYYMQAIWSYEPPDQRFFRLYNMQVQEVERPEDSVLETTPTFYPGIDSEDELFGDSRQSQYVRVNLPGHSPVTFKRLVEIADLNTLLGYKGNYMIFPLKENNPVTMFMMQDFITLPKSSYFGDPTAQGSAMTAEGKKAPQVVDPDKRSQYTTNEVVKIVQCYVDSKSGRLSNAEQTKLSNLVKERMEEVESEPNVVIVPSDSLYIEALRGTHPILEAFKLLHRATDVQKAQAEVRHEELENLRLALRLIEQKLEDPDIDKKISVEGINQPTTAIVNE